MNMTPTIFGGNTNMTYEQVQSKRRLADQLMAKKSAPRNVGEGLSAIGDALLYRSTTRKADKRDAELRGEYNDMASGVFGGGMFGGPAPTSGGAGGTYRPPEAPNPMDVMYPTGQGGPSPQGNFDAASGTDVGSPAIPDVAGMSSYIMKAAQERGIDPQTALAVAGSEGLNANPADGWQSSVVKDGKRERSYGPFQLYIDGGLGNSFMESTGLDPRDPTTWQAQVDYALDHASKKGWGAWYGAKNTGIGDMQGIGGQPQGQDTRTAQAGGMDMQTLFKIANSPYAKPAEKAMAQYQIQQQMSANDPSAQLDMQYKQAQLNALQAKTNGTGAVDPAQVQSSEILADGSTVMVMKDGNTLVRSPNGCLLYTSPSPRD